MAHLVGDGKLFEQGMRQFMPHTECVFAHDEVERLQAFLFFAHENPDEVIYVTPGALADIEQEPDFADALLNAPDNVVFPQYFRLSEPGIRKTFLNVGQRGAASDEQASRHFPDLWDTTLICSPGNAGIGQILMDKGQGQMSMVPVFDSPDFDEKYRGYAHLARAWFAGWLSDSVMHWETHVGVGGEKSSSLEYQYGRNIAEYFRLRVLFDVENRKAA